MRAFKNLIFVFIFSLLTLTAIDSNAQCAMCGLNADNSVQNGNTQGKGLNAGIMYLLAAPYLAVLGVGYIWVKKYRKKNVTLNMRQEKINLN